MQIQIIVRYFLHFEQNDHPQRWQGSGMTELSNVADRRVNWFDRWVNYWMYSAKDRHAHLRPRKVTPRYRSKRNEYMCPLKYIYANEQSRFTN